MSLSLRLLFGKKEKQERRFLRQIERTGLLPTPRGLVVAQKCEGRK
jgi:hypothetical protein